MHVKISRETTKSIEIELNTFQRSKEKIERESFLKLSCGLVQPVRGIAKRLEMKGRGNMGIVLWFQFWPADP